MTERRPYTFDRVIRIIFSALILAGILLVINYLKGVLLPFFIACLLAYILEPFVRFNKYILKLKSKLLPIFITFFEIIVLFTCLGLFFVPYIISEIQQMITLFQQYAQTQLDIPFFPDYIHDLIVKYADFNYLSNLLTHNEWINLIESSINDVWIVMGGGIRMLIEVFSWLVVFVYLIFIMLDYDKIMTGFKLMIPKKYRKNAYKVINDIEGSMNHYFRGQSLISFIVGVLFSIGFLIIGLPMAVVFGLFVGLLNMVPYLQLVSIPLAAVLCLVNSVATGINFWLIFGETVAVYIIVQAIEDLYLTPKIMGKYMGLNPAIIFLSLSIWGTLLGFIGLIIALPLTTLLISYYDEYVVHGVGDKFLTQESDHEKNKTE